MNVRTTSLAIAVGLCAGPAVALASASGSTTFILLALCGLGLALAIATHPTVGLLVIAFMIPLERFGRITSDASNFTISVMRIVGFLAIGGWLLHVMLKKKQIQLGAAFWLYVGYLILAFGSFLYTTDNVGTSRLSGMLLSNILFFVVVIGICSSYRMAKLGTSLWLLATVLIGVYSIYDWHFSTNFVDLEDGVLASTERFRTVSIDNSEWESGMSQVKRSVGSSSHFASYGINLIGAVPFFFILLRQRPKWYFAALIWLSLFVVFYNVLLTNTRAVLLFFIIVVLLCVFRKIVTVKPPVILAGLLCIVAVTPFVKADIYERILDPAKYTSRGSGTLRIRLAYWGIGWEIFQENWFLGTGIGNELEIPKRSFEKWVPKRTSVHNAYLNMLIELGVVGFVVFFSFVGLLLYQSFQAARLFREQRKDEEYWYMVACQVSMISVILFGVQCEVYHFPLKGWWYVAGATVVMHRIAIDLAKRAARESEFPGKEIEYAV